jgi:hypothetical protein
MEKAYDLKVLASQLKSKGLDIAEDAAIIVVEETIDWLSKSAIASTNKYDDLLVAFYPKIKEYVLELVDKIDGKEG